MDNIANIEKDHRKWILFNTQLSDFQSLYDLYVAVKTKQTKGSVTIRLSHNEQEGSFIIDQEGCESNLELGTDKHRSEFLEYLVRHYFPNEEVEDWYKSKIQETDKNANHSPSLNGIEQHKSEPTNFKVHPKELKYYNLRVLFSALFYLATAGFVINLFFTSMVSGAMAILAIVAIILFFGFIRRITHGLLIGLIKGNTVQLNERQYPELFEIVKEQSKALGLNEVPEMYIADGQFNAFVTKFARKKYLLLFSEVIETAALGNFDIVKFVIGHELGHIKRKHLSKESWLIPSSFIPFLKQAHSRGCEYTCDRIGYHFSNNGAMEGILILATGKEIHTKININQFIEDTNSQKSFWVWFSEKFISHPHIYKRLTSLKWYAESN